MPELRYDITVGANTSGAPKAEAAIRGVTAASNEANAAASAHAAGAAQMWSGLQQAAQGGTNAIVGLGRAIGGAFQAALGAVPIAKWVAMAAQLVGVLGTLLGAVGLFRRAAEDTKTPVDALTAAQEASKRSAEALAKAYSDNLSSSLKAIGTDAAAAIEWAHKLAAANEEVAKSIDNKTKAEIELKKEQGKITEAQAATQLAGVDAAAAGRQAKGRLDAIRIERDEMQKALARASSVAEAPQQALEALLTERNSAQSRQRAAVTAGLEYTAARDEAYSYKNRFGVPFMEVGAQGATPEEYRAFEVARARYQSAEKTYAQALAVAPEEATMKELDASLAKAWKDWEQAAAPVQELKKKTDELTKVLDLRTKTENEVLQNNTAADAAKNAPALTAAEKAKVDADNAKARTKQETQMRALGPNVVATRIASGDTSLNIDLARELFPKQRFVEPSAPAQATTPPPADGAKRIYGPGEEMPSNPSDHVFRGGRLPTDGQPTIPGLGAGNQVTRGALQPGSDTKSGAVVDALKGAADATQSAPTGEAEAKAAEALKSATEQSAQAQQQSGEAIVQALDQTSALARDITAAAAQLTAVTTRHTSEIAQLRSQIANMRPRA